MAIEIAVQVESLLRDIHYSLIRRTRPVLHEWGLTPPRFHALAHVAKHGPLGMSEIQHRLHVSKSTATAIIDGLVQEGLLDRHRPETDRRRVIIEITNEGRKIMEETRRRQVDFVRAALSDTSAAEQRTLVDSLASIKAHLERKE